VNRLGIERHLVLLCCLMAGVIGMMPAATRAQTRDSQQEQTEKKLPSPKTALIKSAIIPGWGQFYNRRYLKAAGFFSVEAYMGYEFFRLNHKLDHTTGSKERDQVEYDRNTWAWRYLAVYLLCITDAFVDAHLAGFPENNSVSLRLTPRMNGWAMHISVSF